MGLDPVLLETLRAFKRFNVIGTSGSGKSTFAKNLAASLDLKHIELDAFRHEPNWREAPDEIFRERVAEAVTAERWIVDGNYGIARDLVWPRAEVIIWLDYSFPRVFWQVFTRTIRRSVKREVLWNGNRESLWKAFCTRESILLWVLQTYWKKKRTTPALFERPEYGHLKIVRLSD